MKISITKLYHYAECHYAEYCVIFVVILSVIVMNVLAPLRRLTVTKTVRITLKNLPKNDLKMFVRSFVILLLSPKILLFELFRKIKKFLLAPKLFLNFVNSSSY